jgi:G protein pathway suppressor 2
MKEEQERRKKKEMEERMSLEKTKEQILKLQEKLLALQEEKHQLFLLLKFCMRKKNRGGRSRVDLTTLTPAAYQQGLRVHTGTPFLSIQRSHGGHNRPGTLMSANRAKQMFGPQVWAQQLLSQGPQNMGNSKTAR